MRLQRTRQAGRGPRDVVYVVYELATVQSIQLNQHKIKCESFKTNILLQQYIHTRTRTHTSLGVIDNVQRTIAI